MDGERTATASRATPLVRIGPARRALDLRELVAYRELAYVLAWRDVKVRYRQSAVGATWALLQPLLTMAVLSLFLGRVDGLAPAGIPYPLFAYSGLVPWVFCANAVGQAAASLLAHQELVTKVYFPRPIIPLASVLASAVDLAVPTVVLVVLAATSGFRPGPELLALPLFLLLAVVSALGVGTLLAAATLRYRDLRHVVPFLVQLWFFATPVAYAASVVPARWARLVELNPMAGAVQGVRWCLLGTPLSPRALLVSAVVAAAVATLSLRYFRRSERSFADLV